MLPLQDAQVRLVLLNHVTLRLADAALDELHAAGIEMEQLAHLRQLSAVDLRGCENLPRQRARCFARRV